MFNPFVVGPYAEGSLPIKFDSESAAECMRQTLNPALVQKDNALSESLPTTGESREAVGEKQKEGGDDSATLPEIHLSGISLGVNVGRLRLTVATEARRQVGMTVRCIEGRGFHSLVSLYQLDARQRS